MPLESTIRGDELKLSHIKNNSSNFDQFTMFTKLNSLFAMMSSVFFFQLVNSQSCSDKVINETDIKCLI